MDRFRAVFEVNVFATLESVQHAARKLVKKGDGKIVFLSSMAGIITTGQQKKNGSGSMRQVILHARKIWRNRMKD